MAAKVVLAKVAGLAITRGGDRVVVVVGSGTGTGKPTHQAKVGGGGGKGGNLEKENA